MEYLVVGLGNPGRTYAQTRHNVGFLSVEKFVERQGFSFRLAAQFSGKIAMGKVVEKSIYALLPLTYMNKSGEAVGLVARYFHIPTHHLLVVCDDINIPFGSLRIRSEGSAGGHNGLKSIETHLGTRDYARLRIGVGDRTHGDLADHVLGDFTEKEREEIPQIIENAAASIEQWLKLTGE